MAFPSLNTTWRRVGCLGGALIVLAVGGVWIGSLVHDARVAARRMSDL